MIPKCPVCESGNVFIFHQDQYGLIGYCCKSCQSIFNDNTYEYIQDLELYCREANLDEGVYESKREFGFEGYE